MADDAYRPLAIPLTIKATEATSPADALTIGSVEIRCATTLLSLTYLGVEPATAAANYRDLQNDVDGRRTRFQADITVALARALNLRPASRPPILTRQRRVQHIAARYQYWYPRARRILDTWGVVRGESHWPMYTTVIRDGYGEVRVETKHTRVAARDLFRAIREAFPRPARTTGTTPQDLAALTAAWQQHRRLRGCLRPYVTTILNDQPAFVVDVNDQNEWTALPTPQDLALELTAADLDIPIGRITQIIRAPNLTVRDNNQRRWISMGAWAAQVELADANTKHVVKAILDYHRDLAKPRI